MTNWDKVKEIFFRELTLSKFENENIIYNMCDTINLVRHNQKRKDGVCNFDCTACYKWLKQEYKPSILDKAEKKYLSNIIRPFRDKVIGIIKKEYGTKEYVQITLKNESGIDLPFFDKGSMYKGMRAFNPYTLKELGL